MNLVKADPKLDLRPAPLGYRQMRDTVKLLKIDLKLELRPAPPGHKERQDGLASELPWWARPPLHPEELYFA